MGRSTHSFTHPVICIALLTQDWSLVDHVRTALEERAQQLSRGKESVQGQCNALTQEAEQERLAVRCVCYVLWHEQCWLDLRCMICPCELPLRVIRPELKRESHHHVCV